MSRHIAIIGTAGRDPKKPLTKELWLQMLADARSRVGPDDFIYSGGAAWSDHIPVSLFLEQYIKHLSLWLPAPINSSGVFLAPPPKQSTAADFAQYVDKNSAAASSNYYHEKFSRIIGVRSREQIIAAQIEGAWINCEPASHGYGAFFARNNKVAERAVDGCIAYTWGEGDEPMDGGTKYTWDRCLGTKVHVPLSSLLKEKP